MKIKRTLDTSTATYDFLEVSESDFNTMFKAYEHYMAYIRHAPPAEDDALYNKMRKLQEDRITVV